jgi:hypothetical protein
MMKQFDHMIEPKLNLELSNVFPCLKFLAGCGQFSDFSNKRPDIHPMISLSIT